MRYGVVGTGTIATAVVQGFAGQGAQITVSERSAANALLLSTEFPNVAVAPNQQVVDQSDVVFLGTTGAVAEAVLSALTFRADQRVISFMADFPPARVVELVAPARLEAVMIPFPAIAKGGSPIFTCPDAPLVRDLFGAKNRIIAFTEMNQMQPYMAAQAVLSPALKLLDETAVWLAARTQDADTADGFLRALVASALQAAPLKEGLAALGTPGGLNAQLRDHMMAQGVGRALAQGLNDLETRLTDG